MTQPPLPLNLPEASTAPDLAVRTHPSQARLRRPVRNQVQWIARDLESLVPDDHPVRAVWALVERLDLSAFYARIRVSLVGPGRPAIDPPVLLAVWVYATSEGVGATRRVADLCAYHDAYRWLCGGIVPNYHTLADFRVAHQAELDELLTAILAPLLAQGLITLREVAQDGMRVRASASSSSFRRQASLEECRDRAQAQVAALAAEAESGASQATAREQAARERAARERRERIDEALRQMPAVRAAKQRQEKTLTQERRRKIPEPRVSTTDPEARVMKMANGGFNPALNVELATETEHGFIIGVDVVNQGSDSGQAAPMVEQIEQRLAQTPGSVLMDGGFAQREAVTTLEQAGITVYAPLRPPRTTTSGREASTPRPDDTPEVIAWRARMATPEAQAIYRHRATWAEKANARMRQQGLSAFRVRGLVKARTLALLMVITYNLVRLIALGD